jgi:hypothetical protein
MLPAMIKSGRASRFYVGWHSINKNFIFLYKPLFIFELDGKVCCFDNTGLRKILHKTEE